MQPYAEFIAFFEGIFCFFCDFRASRLSRSEAGISRKRSGLAQLGGSHACCVAEFLHFYNFSQLLMKIN